MTPTSAQRIVAWAELVAVGFTREEAFQLADAGYSIVDFLAWDDLLFTALPD